jgi:hypothetical protein
MPPSATPEASKKSRLDNPTDAACLAVLTISLLSLLARRVHIEARRGAVESSLG